MPVLKNSWKEQQYQWQQKVVSKATAELKTQQKTIWWQLNQLNFTDRQHLHLRSYIWKIHEKSDNNNEDNYWIVRQRGVILKGIVKEVCFVT